MKRKLLTIAFALFAAMLMAQNRPRRAVYNEYAGASGIIGANFDSRFSANSHLGYRLGLAYNAGRTSEKSEDGASVYQGPAAVFEAYGLIGRANHSLELGVGMMHGIFLRTYEWDASPCPGCSYEPYEAWNYGYYAFVNVGYRYQPAIGFFLRAGVNPTFVPETRYGISRFLVYPYLGLGFAF